MDRGDARPAAGPQLVELEIADEPRSWAAAGFAIADDATTTIGGIRLRLTGRSEAHERGIVRWTIEGIEVADGALDGLPTADRRSDTGGSTPPPSTAADGHRPTTGHPNGVIGMDHVVVLTPDLERTIDACVAAGLDLRRIREGPGGNGVEVRQAFFRLGTTILEVVSGPDQRPADQPAPSVEDRPARWFGLACDVDDLDAMAARLGDGLGSIKPAVQPGQRIATLRHKAFGMSVPIAVLDRHGDR